MTKKQQAKIDKLIEWLDKVSEKHTWDVGGYPDVNVHIPGYLVIAGLNEAKERNGPDLAVFTEAAAIRWHDDVVEYLKDISDEDKEDDFSLTEAVLDCRPLTYFEEQE